MPRPPIIVIGTPAPAVATKDAGPVFVSQYKDPSTEVSATATETTYDKYVEIPAGAKKGDVYEYSLVHHQNGRYSTDTTDIRVHMDNASGATLFDTGALAVVSGSDIEVKGAIQITEEGVGGAYKVISGAAGIGSQGYYTGTADFTVAHKLAMTVTFSSNNAGNKGITPLGTLKRFRP